MYLLTEMAHKGQIELLGGGLYNPIASLVSTQDLTAQIENLSTLIRKTAGKRPSGAWLYEYSWNAALPSILQNSKIQYTFLPAAVFPDESNGIFVGEPVVTEDHRKTIAVFPTFESRTNDGTFVPFEATLVHLQESHLECKNFVVMADANEVSMTWDKSGVESP